MSKSSGRDLVVAAQRGDRRAREELARAYLPLVYNVVGRALAGHPDHEDAPLRLAGRLTRAAHANPIVATAATAIVLVAGAGIAYASTPDQQRPVPRAVAPPPSSVPPSSVPPSNSPPPRPTPKATKAKAATAAKTGCGAGLSRIWASWPMPNPQGTGLPHPVSYTSPGNGTVRDNVTCLTWQQAPAPQTYTFAAAKSYCAGLDLDGGGWHLPSRVELPAPKPAQRWALNYNDGFTTYRPADTGHVRCVH